MCVRGGLRMGEGGLSIGDREELVLGERGLCVQG